MGEVVGLIRVMPGEVLEMDKLQKIIDEIKGLIKPPAKLGNIEIKPIAFGLKGLNVTIVVPDDAGGIDPIAEKIAKIKYVDSAEVTDVGLLWYNKIEIIKIIFYDSYLKTKIYQNKKIKFYAALPVFLRWNE